MERRVRKGMENRIRQIYGGEGWRKLQRGKFGEEGKDKTEAGWLRQGMERVRATLGL